MISIVSQVLQRTLGVGMVVLWIASCIAGVSEATPDAQGTPETGNVLAGEQKLWYGSAAGESWQTKPAPGAGRIECLSSDPLNQGRILLCRNGTVWMSQDHGVSWGAPIFSSQAEPGVAAAFHPTESDQLFLVTNRRLWISTDAGKDWEPATPGVEFKWRPRAILTSILEPNRLYITTRGEGMYRSDDGGHSWKAINAGLPEAIGAAPVAPINSAVLDSKEPDVMYVAAEAQGVYKTTDGGETWMRASKGLPETITHRTYPWVLAIDPSDPTRLLLWAAWPVHSERVDSAFFLSEDGAASWNSLAIEPDIGQVFAIQFVDAEDRLAVAVTEDGVVLLPRLSSSWPGTRQVERRVPGMPSDDRALGGSLLQQAITRDEGEIAVIEGDTNIIFTPDDSSGNPCPDDSVDMEELAKKFYATHGDDFGFLIAFTTFNHLLSPDANCNETANAFYQPVSNAIQGIGRSIFNNSANYGSASALGGVINMGNVNNRPADPTQRLLGNNDSLLSLFGQEVGHLWGAFVQFDADPDPSIVNASNDLLGRGNGHWSFFMHTASATSSTADPEASSLEGNFWNIINHPPPLPPVIYQTATETDGFSPLDLYLMGLLPAGDVGQFWYLSSPFNVNPARADDDAPEAGVQAQGTQRFVTTNDIVAVEAARNPSFNNSPKIFRQAFILLTPQGTNATQAELDRIDDYREAWENYFDEETQRRGAVVTNLDDVLFVDHTNNSGTEDGTLANPYNTVDEGRQNSASDGALIIRAGQYGENLTFSTPVTLRAVLGTVTIGTE